MFFPNIRVYTQSGFDPAVLVLAGGDSRKINASFGLAPFQTRIHQTDLGVIHITVRPSCFRFGFATVLSLIVDTHNEGRADLKPYG